MGVVSLFQFILSQFSSYFLTPYVVKTIIKRAENCVVCIITHIYFENDSLVFVYEKIKGYQEEK